ncbi:hypothetical protein KAR48_00160 [bacterium]|nr:hypothetical protein [bacterium]
MNDNMNTMMILIKGELYDRREQIIGIGSFYLIIAVLFVGWGRNELDNSLPALRAAVIAAFALFWVFDLTTMQKTHRIRYWSQLPIKYSNVGIARLIPMESIIVMLLLVYSACRIIAGAIDGLLLELALGLGLSFFANAMLQIHPDLTAGFHGKPIRITGGIIIGLIMMGANFIFILLIISKDLKKLEPMALNIKNIISLFLTPGGVMSIIALGVLCCFFSVRFFQLRKSFLE